MGNYYSSGWGLIFWIGIWGLLLITLGNWGYTFRANKKSNDIDFHKSARDILDERYARGEITREDYARLRSEIFGENSAENPDEAKKIA